MNTDANDEEVCETLENVNVECKEGIVWSKCCESREEEREYMVNR